MTDAQLAHRDAFTEVRDAAGTFRTLNPPFRFSDAPCRGPAIRLAPRRAQRRGARRSRLYPGRDRRLSQGRRPRLIRPCRAPGRPRPVTRGASEAVSSSRGRGPSPRPPLRHRMRVANHAAMDLRPSWSPARARRRGTSRPVLRIARGDASTRSRASAVPVRNATDSAIRRPSSATSRSPSVANASVARRTPSSDASARARNRAPR